MEAIEELIDLGSNILWRTPDFLIGRFKRLIEKPQLFNDYNKLKALLKQVIWQLQTKILTD